MSADASPWNSLEIAKLIADFSVPVIVLFIGLWIKRFANRIEHQHWQQQKVIEWKISIFERLIPKLNIIYICYSYTGKWKEITPPQILLAKRDADEIFHTYSFLWSYHLKERYRTFIYTCFEEERGKGRDAGLRANVDMFRLVHSDWKPGWDDMFVAPENRLTRKDLKITYDKLVLAITEDLGLGARLR